MQFVDTIVFAVCLVVTFSGIVGKGTIFKNDNVHESKKVEYRKVIRIFSLTAGPLGMLSIGLLWLAGDQPVWSAVSWILYAILIVEVIALVVYCYLSSSKHIDKKKSGK